MWSQLQSMLGRMDYLLTYSLVQFMQKVIQRFLSAQDIFYVAVVLVVCSARVTKVGSVGQSLYSLHKVAAVLLADTIMGAVPSPSGEHTSLFQLVVFWVLSTAAVVLVPTLLAEFTREEVSSQVSSLIFFMYAENSSVLTSDLEIDKVLPMLALLCLYFIRGRQPDAEGVERTVLQALSMMGTNVIISTLVTTSDATSSDMIEIAWLVGVLILFDNLEPWLDVAAELKDYALWKASTLLLARLLFRQIDLESIVLGVLLCIALAYALQLGLRSLHYELRYNAMIQLGVLVALNATLQAVQHSIQHLPHSIVWVVILSVVNVVHVMLDLFTPEQDSPPDDV